MAPEYIPLGGDNLRGSDLDDAGLRGRYPQVRLLSQSGGQREAVGKPLGVKLLPVRLQFESQVSQLHQRVP